ncbi:hypothetical protein GM658_28265 [Pseudoduganella eburnea]|uniref:DUF1640 domain-containing protein n=1 Tax=Massilia eburnea TaxID=1776165 RepID=A0A6L6QQP2_9BURK|nr:hypothetical protein [Massilia eburnea]MTW14515.1 hypothetical protein [Massilia eburnea]
MNGTSKQVLDDEEAVRATRECISALAMLVAAINRLMDEHPEFKDQLMPSVTQLGGALSRAAKFPSIGFDALESRLNAVEAAVTQLQVDVAQLKDDVAQLKSDVAQLKSDVAQLKNDVAGLKTDMALVKATLIEHKEIFLTKEEFHKEMHKMTWRIYSCMAALMGAVYFIARYVH